ncbi:polycystic kidney disease protein 1-like 2 [Pecten maximus]|uniref:polycystic kidney disease protein 1-like 2 n=1 Tax=Pecten maximus TaxID=6579 RepID=UPI00145847F6|nr:polycystic kidney disease protein 1-like 2 [Pecten maximus]
MSVVILEFPCTFPKVTIMGFSSNRSRPSYSYPSVALTLRALADTYCMPIHNVVFEWNITGPDGSNFNQASIKMASLPYLYIPPLSLGYGLYAINVTVYIEGYPFFNDSSIVYIYEEPTPLILELVGGDTRTVVLGNSVALDASQSLDLDFPIHQTLYEMTWYTWTESTEFDPVVHEHSAYLKPLEYSFPSLPVGASDNTTTVIIPGADLQSVMTKTVVAKMTQGSQVKWKMQDIMVTDTSVSMLTITCVENCYSIVSADLPVRMKGECLTCTQYNRLQLNYAWKLYKIESAGTFIINSFDTLTYTGINSANLAIKPGLLEPGGMYEVRLESGDDYTTRTFRVTWPPYNGECKTNINIGLAFKSKFIVSCTGWLDEGDDETRDITKDKHYTRNYEFTFYVMVNTSSEYRRTPVFRVLGSWATAPEMMLSEGDPSSDYRVELVVTVKDFYGSHTTVTNTVKVMPPVYTTLEAINCTEMLLYEAEKDMMGILMLANGVTHRLKQDIDSNADNLENGVKVMTATIDKMTDNGDLIQDEVLAANAVDTLNSMLSLDSTVGNLKAESKMKMGNLYQSVASSFESRFKSSMTSDEKQNLATDLLSGVVTYAQHTKYSADCSSGCDDKFKQGEYVVEFIRITHNISAILLEGTVPGEGERIVSIPEYNTILSVQRSETLELFNSTLTLQGQPIVDVPDLSETIDCEVNGHVDVEIMVADNLYTTDSSWTQVKAQTTSLALHVDGEILQVSDLVSTIKVRSQPHILQGLTFTPANLSSNDDSSLFYIQLRVNESNITPLFLLRSHVENVTLRYYVKFGTPPTQEDYDLIGLVTPLDLQDVSGNRTLWQAIIQLADSTLASSLGTSSDKILYLGLRTENRNGITKLQIALYVLDCLFWDDKTKQWSRSGLSLGNITTYSEAPCESTHLTTFGTNVFVPPNTINFNTVWSKFSADNVAVISTVGGLLVVYFLVLFCVRRADKRDVTKWAIYPLCDNLSTDRYHYQITVYTGMRQNSGTTSKVFFVLGGEDGDTEVRSVEDNQSRPLTRGSVNNYLLSVPFNLGNLVFLRIWHDNSGKGKDADWFLNMVLIKDLQNNQKFVFLCNQWLAVDKGDQEIERLLPVATQSELSNFDHLFYTRTRQDLTDGHLWISVLSRPTQSVFTRVQRLSCCLSLLFLTMVTNAMWYGTIDTTQQQNVHLGPFTFSGQELITSIAGSLIVVPVSIIIITFFKKSERRMSKDLLKVDKSEPEEEEDSSRHDKMMSKKGLDQYCSDECCDEREGCVSPSVIDTALVQPFSMYKSWADFENRTSRLISSRKNQQKTSDGEKKKKRNPLPFWCLYVAWTLVVLSVLASGFFVILYSIEWGTEKSSRWLTAFFLSFIESVIFIQPLKVVTVALVLILVFKRVDDDDEEAYVNKIVLPDIMATDPRSLSYPAHRRPYKEKPSDYTHLESAREHRKRMNRLFNIGRELVAYIIYLVVVCILTYENRSKNAYPTYSHLENTFLKPPAKNHSSFVNISSAEYFWNWAHDILIPGLYSQGMYSGNDSGDYHGYLSDNVHYRVGTPRVRQARVTKADCSIPSEFRKFFKECYPEYGLDTYDSESYGEGWATHSSNNTSQAWQYQDSIQLNGYPVVAKYDSYGGGGYVTTLGNSNQTAADTFDYLHDAGWIDRNTRAVLVEANIYNPNVNLFCVICLVLEFPASGSIIPYSQISPVVLYRYIGSSALFLLILDLIFVAFTLYYLFILVNKIKQEKCEFFKQFWNIIDLLNMAFSITACAFYGMHFIMVELATSDFQRNKDAYLNLQYIVLWEALFGYMLAFLLFLSMLKLLLILRFNPKITQLSGTLQKAKGPISNFMVVFVLTFLAFAQFGYLVFGRVDHGYYTFITTLETLMSMLMMKMEIDNMILVNGLLGSLFVFLFVLFIVFILINMLLSVINDAFTEVRKDPSFLPDDPAMVTFLLDQVKAFILGYSKDSTKKGRADEIKEDEKDLEGKIDDLDLRLRTFLQVLHKDRD